jgi:hypothetical protein
LDVEEFLELEKQTYLDKFPHNKAIFDDEDEEDDTEMDSTKKKPMETTTAVKKGEGKKKRRLEEVDISKDSSFDDASDGDGYSDLLSGEVINNCIRREILFSSRVMWSRGTKSTLA